MEPKSERSPSCQAGFTLVEIMVGLTIGMLATLVILQVMVAFETQKRTTTGTADAQTNGGIALYSIGRELQMAGYPLLPVTNSALMCTSLTIDGTAASTNRLSPVTITDGGAAGASDTITLRYGNSAMGGVPTQITAAPVASATAPRRDVTVAGSMGCLVSDKMLITNGTACTMSNVVAVPGTTTVTFVDPAPPLAATEPATAVTATEVTAAVGNANLACLGTWNEITYAVSNGNLQRNGVDSVAGIVNIQAQYGISAAVTSGTFPNTALNFNQVTSWVNPSGATWGAKSTPIASTTPTVADRNRIKAVRIAIVARNPKKEPGIVTTACTTAKGTVNNGPCAWDDTHVDAAPKIDLSSDTDWQHYRYRVFETIIPLRNVIWAKDKL